MSNDLGSYERQGFGAALPLKAPYGLLIVDFVNGFADPAQFGGGNIAGAIETTRTVLAAARERGWAVAHSRIVYADDDADGNIFSIKVPGMLTLKEHAPASAIVPQLAPQAGEYVVRKSTPSAFYGTMLAAWLRSAGCRRCWWPGRPPAGACAPAWSTRCRRAFGRWCCPIAWAIARWARTRPTCSTCARNTPP
ncbi:isochorismatase family protein [Bordetella bronchiseptica SBL-F6116]|nr:isochorismatase family protein [Bordetella bronchiseptica SBL-F6116]